ncbi:MAG: hypothetical protein NWQ21_11105, partial [Desulfobacterales bacterium]|nr:hypothetical protein [Desulfobacterales bacterium]
AIFPGFFAMCCIGSVSRDRFNFKSTISLPGPVRCGKNSSGAVRKLDSVKNHPWWIFMQPSWTKNWAVAVS